MFTDKFALRSQPLIVQVRSLIFLVSICDRLNWDFVLGPLAHSLSEITNQFNLKSVHALSPVKFRRAFGSYRRADGSIKFGQKLKTLKAVARYLLDDDSIPKLLLCASVQGKDGAKSLILEMPGYNADPLAKKCNALLHEINRRKLVTFSDADMIDPAVDYHIMRLYLRTGRVEIRDMALSQRLLQRKRVRIERITEIRHAVAEAMRYTAWINRMSVSRLNDLEWLFARKACRRDGVWCSGAISCPLETVCPSANLNPYRMITEPESRHGHY
jgi:hypothetical protein